MKRNNIHIKYWLSIFVVVFLICGCTSKYPTELPAKIGTDNFICKKLSGKYSNPAKYATELQWIFEEPTNPTIEYFIGHNLRVSPDYFIISFTVKSELKFELFDETQKKYDEYIFIKDKEYKCKNDHVYLKGPDWWTMDNISGNSGFYYANRLYLGEDGSLIVYSIEKRNIIGNSFIWAHFIRTSE